jgi:adenine-specific DNA-methyltransferase
MEESSKIISDCTKPSEYAAAVGEQILLNRPHWEKQRRGQYFTPLSLAAFMGTLAESKGSPESVKILDPGCGTGMLSCVLIEHLVITSNVREIELVCYENDKMVIPGLNKSISYLSEWLCRRNINFNAVITEEDFVDENQDILSSSNDCRQLFDYIISNPPFFKVSQSIIKDGSVPEVFSEQPNIYFFFLLIAGRLLKENGDLIFLLPRSFCSGGYYKKFRDIFLNYVIINSIYQIDTGKKVFKDRGMLSEFVVLHGSKIKELDNNYDIRTSVVYFPSGNSKLNFIFNFSRKENIIYLPASNEDIGIIGRVSSYKGSLRKSGLEIRQGNVLYSKVKEFILHETVAEVIPYLDAKSISGVKISSVVVNNSTIHMAVPNKNYVLFARYNTHKNSRLTAVVHSKRNYNADYILIDKQLNYITAKDKELSIEEAEHIAGVLNSDILNKYIKIINGNINITPDMLMDIPITIDRAFK